MLTRKEYILECLKAKGGSMNTVRIVKSDADVYQAGRTYVDITECYAIKDTIPVTSNWKPEEVAVLAGMDAAAWISFYWGYAAWVNAHDDMVAQDVYTYLRSHIQAEIKRQEG